MPDISNIDKNLKIVSSIEKENIKWLNANNSLFSLHGIFYEKSKYKRMDTEIAKKVSDGVSFLHTNTSGGRITFETDSDYIAINTEGDFTTFPHMPLTGTAGFDLYIYDEKFRFYKSFVPPVDVDDKYESIIEFDSVKKRKILIHFPLYSDVFNLFIGINSNCEISEFNPYKNVHPVVYYGSSITQGGCASRPGNNYPAIVSQNNLTDFICLGFSGNAHGEPIIADYIASLNMSAFVLDYDYNDVSNPENLEKNHFSFYKTIRKKHPDIPIVIMSAPYSFSNEKALSVSGKIVYNSYNKAKEKDNNVFFIDCKKIYDENCKGCATVDGTHPNDYGFVKMAQAVQKILK